MIGEIADGGNKWGISTPRVYVLQIVPLVSLVSSYQKTVRPFLAFKSCIWLRAILNIFPIQSHKLLSWSPSSPKKKKIVKAVSYFTHQMPLWKNVNGIFAHHCLFTKTMLLEVIPGDSSDPTSFANEKPTHLLLLEDFCIMGFVASKVPPYETSSKITWANECRWFKFPFVRKRADDWISLV